MRPDQLPLLFTVGQPTVAPDGSFAVVSATRPSFEADAYTGQLWRVPLGEGAPTRLTRGFRDTAPALSPDGRLIAFVRAQPGLPGQIWVAPATGGEAAQVALQMPSAITGVFQGMLLFFLLGSDVFIDNRLRKL